MHGPYRGHHSGAHRQYEGAGRDRIYHRDPRGGHGCRRAPVRPRRRAPGHRSRRLTRTGHCVSRRHSGLPRQPHMHPGRAGRARLGHRLDRDGTRDGDQDSGRQEAETDAGPVRRPARHRRYGEGPDPPPDRRIHRGRRRRLRNRVRRRGHSRDADGGALHTVQHDGRVRRMDRHHRARRRDIRIQLWPALRTPGRDVGSRA